jgi:hypothetical protein
MTKVKIRSRAQFLCTVFALAGILLGAPASAQTVIFQLGVDGSSPRSVSARRPTAGLPWAWTGSSC